MIKIDVLEDYKERLNQINSLKLDLDKINEEKEMWFKKKEDLKKEINDRIRDIKELKIKKDKENIELNELKKQRNKHNDAVKELVKKVKKLKKEKDKVFDKFNIKIDPSDILEKINLLEKQVEIETSFAKEQKLMEQIRRLRRSYDEGSQVSHLIDNIKLLEKGIQESKKKADDFHSKIQDLTNSPGYNEFLNLSQKINNLKKEQEDAFNRFIEFKNKFNQSNNILKELFKNAKETKSEIDKNKELQKMEKEEKSKVIMKKKEEDIEKKLKEKKKLTTDDLLALQGEIK